MFRWADFDETPRRRHIEANLYRQAAEMEQGNDSTALRPDNQATSNPVNDQGSDHAAAVTTVTTVTALKPVRIAVKPDFHHKEPITCHRSTARH